RTAFWPETSLTRSPSVIVAVSIMVLLLSIPLLEVRAGDLLVAPQHGRLPAGDPARDRQGRERMRQLGGTGPAPEHDLEARRRRSDRSATAPSPATIVIASAIPSGPHTSRWFAALRPAQASRTRRGRSTSSSSGSSAHARTPGWPARTATRTPPSSTAFHRS